MTQTESIETRAGAPGRFTFGGQTYRVAPASPAQHFELLAVLRKHAPNPLAEAAELLRSIGDALTPAERSEILRDARDACKPRYVTKVRVSWDTEADGGVDVLGLDAEDLGRFGLDPATSTVGTAAKVAYRRGLRPDPDRSKAGPTPAESRLRDALNEHFAGESQEITEQVGGWPPALNSPEAANILYAGPGLPDVLGIMLPPWNEGMDRKAAEGLGTSMLDDATGRGIADFLAAFDGRGAEAGGDGDSADPKSGDSQPD